MSASETKTCGAPMFKDPVRTCVLPSPHPGVRHMTRDLEEFGAPFPTKPSVAERVFTAITTGVDPDPPEGR